MSGKLIGIEELFKQVFEIYRRRALILFAIIVLTGLIALISGGAFALLGLGLSSVLGDFKDIATALTSALAFIAIFISILVGEGAFIFAVADEELGIRGALRSGLRRMWSLMWLLLLMSFLIGGGYFLFIIPGILFSVWFAFGPFILASEDERGMKAVLKSKAYVDGFGFEVFIRLFVLWLVSLGLSLVPFIGPILSILYAPFLAIGLYFIYDNLRSLKPLEGFAVSGGSKAVWLGTASIGYVVGPVILLLLIGTALLVPMMLLLAGNGLQSPEFLPKVFKPGNMDTFFSEPSTPEELGLEGTWAGTDESAFKDHWGLKIAGHDLELRSTEEKGRSSSNFKGRISFVGRSIVKDHNIIDIDITEYPSAGMLGKTALGIFKIENSILKFCTGVPGSGIRPLEFEPSSGIWCLVFLPSSPQEYAEDEQPSPGAPDLAEMVFVAGGCFQMGDAFMSGKSGPGNSESDTCLDPFLIDKHEVTQGEYEKFAGKNPSRFEGEENPVSNVSWRDANQYCKGKGLRLPSEAEWEYAARDGGRSTHWAGTDLPMELHKYAWFGKAYGKGSSPVGLKMPNSLGIFDMSGNVWEMTSDIFQETDSLDKKKRVIRGGAWFNTERLVSVVSRQGLIEAASGDAIGFRCAFSGQIKRAQENETEAPPDARTDRIPMVQKPPRRLKL